MTQGSPWLELLASWDPGGWDLLQEPPGSAAENMARDERWLEEVRVPTLLLYSWRRPSLSLGYGQPDGWVDRARLEALGVELVRRPTGGRALLHLPGEITYAFLLPSCGRTSVGEAFSGLAGLLGRSLRRLGLPVEWAPEGCCGPHRGSPSCTQVIAAGEIVVAGRKFVGSAQLRRGGRLLQHGAIPRSADPALLAEVVPGGAPGVDLASLGFEDLEPGRLLEALAEELTASAPGAGEAPPERRIEFQ